MNPPNPPTAHFTIDPERHVITRILYNGAWWTPRGEPPPAGQGDRLRVAVNADGCLRVLVNADEPVGWTATFASVPDVPAPVQPDGGPAVVADFAKAVAARPAKKAAAKKTAATPRKRAPRKKPAEGPGVP